MVQLGKREGRCFPYSACVLCRVAGRGHLNPARICTCRAPQNCCPLPAGGCVKWTDKWAERLYPDGAKEEWGDKWEENFKDGRGTKQVRQPGCLPLIGPPSAGRPGMCVQGAGLVVAGLVGCLGRAAGQHGAGAWALPMLGCLAAASQIMRTGALGILPLAPSG